MPWFDRQSWQDGLRLHGSLQRFMLQTQGYLIGDEEVPIFTRAAREVRLVRQWLDSAPLKLYNFIVWTGSSRGGGHLCVWDLKESGLWKMREKLSTDPENDPIDVPFM
jgi:hypothetical protein